MAHVYIWYDSNSQSYRLHGNDEKFGDAKGMAQDIEHAKPHSVRDRDDYDEVRATAYADQDREYRVTIANDKKIWARGAVYVVTEINMLTGGGTGSRSCGYFKVKGLGDPP